MSTPAKTCLTCLWRWKDLQGGEQYRCYHGQSSHYHREVGRKRCCACYERRLYLVDAHERSQNRQR